ncbi:MAG TPA: serine/threonine-protein kinase [Kofleriaceae bacterium]
MKRGDLTGEVLDGRYRVDERVGRGAMGSVYRGERLRLGRVVAIKVMQDGTLNEASRKRFEREAMAMAKLEHPHCAHVLDVGVHDDSPYVVMEFVDGKNLKQVIEAGPLPLQRVVDIMRQVLSGLSHAHEHGVIHRDIKPANIVLSQKSGIGDHVKILDFGLARFNEEKSNLTAGLVVGTPNYMAPEQIGGAAIDQRTDLYACGVMLFELLTGSKPFGASDPVATCMKHLKEAPPRLADVAPGRTLGPFEDVVARALAKDPAGRFANAHEFSRALVEAGLQVSKVPTGESTVSLDADSAVVEVKEPPKLARAATPGKRRRPIVAIGAAVVAAGLGAALFIATRTDADPPQPAVPIQIPVAEPPVAKQVTEKADPVSDLVTRATELASGGRRQEAIDLLLKARKTYASDARLPYNLAKLYLDKMWWADGLKQARAALALDPQLKNDPDLIKLALRGFNSTKSYDWTLARFLRDDIGDAAKPYLEDVAKNHPNPIVRSRATAELRRYHGSRTADD